MPDPFATNVVYLDRLLRVAEFDRIRARASGSSGLLAPPPNVDRFPFVLGKNLTLERISSIMRLCTSGYRQQYCDLVNELLERDPHAYGVCYKVVSSVANADYRIVEADLGEQATEAEKKLAIDIAQNIQARFEAIENRKQALTNLAWGIVYGVAAGEARWFFDDEGAGIETIETIHTRRLAYPDQTAWDLYVWDQGALQPFGGSPIRTNGVVGLRLDDYPAGKFVVHTPSVRGDYPTREGIGRELVFWMAVKHAAARGAPNYLERFVNPLIDVTYMSGTPEEKRKATPEDIDNAKAALAGALRSFLHSDAIKLEVLSPDGGTGKPKITFREWIEICDAQMSKGGLGATLSMEANSAGGSRALGESQRKDTQILFQSHADDLATSIRRCVARPLFDRNYPDVPRRFLPRVVATVEDDPDPSAVIDRAAKGVNIGMAIDADKLGAQVGLPIVAADDKKARVLKPVAPSAPNEAPVAPKVEGNSEPAEDVNGDENPNPNDGEDADDDTE